MIGILKSENAKLGSIACTYRGRSAVGKQSTCPTDCPLRSAGCYAKAGPMAWGTKRAEQNPENDAEQILEFIPTIPFKGQLRLHVKGDFYLNGKLDLKYIHALRQALWRRQDIRAWTYTHTQSRKDLKFLMDIFSDTSLVINVSADRLSQAAWMFKAGRPTVVVVGEDFSTQSVDGVYFQLCPALHTKGFTCSQCGICKDADRNFVVAFRAHGTYRKRLLTRT